MKQNLYLFVRKNYVQIGNEYKYLHCPILTVLTEFYVTLYLHI